MIDPATGPFLFDTSVTSYFARTAERAEQEWLRAYLSLHPVQTSVITVLERLRGYALALERAPPLRRPAIETGRAEYLRSLDTPGTVVVPLMTAMVVVGGQLMALSPAPPSPPRRSHRLAESRQERLSRWRFDILIAATALVAGLPLVHHNPEDFESLRGAVERWPDRFPGVGPLHLISVKRLALPRNVGWR